MGTQGHQEANVSDEAKSDKAINDLPPKTQLNINSIGLLENISTQILKLLTTNSTETLIHLTISGGDTFEGEVFETLLTLFKQVKNVYSKQPLLKVRDIAPGLWYENEQCPYILKSQENHILAAIRKANIVIYLLSIMGRLQYGFSFLDDNFMDIFCPEAKELPFEDDRVLATSLGRLLKPQAVLYLNLKTQAYISAMEPWKEESDTAKLSQIKQETLDMVFTPNMREFLVAKKRFHSNKLSPSEEDFVKRCAHRRDKLCAYASLDQLISEYDWLEFFKEIFLYVQRNIGLLVWGRKTPGSGVESWDIRSNSPSSIITWSSTLSQGSSTSEHCLDARKSSSNERLSPAAARETPIERKPKQKRLWTKEEETALIDALKIYGPSWSKILELHGAGGSLSESLKRRTQVQLKDKARNWKMYFLKGGLVVPEYLTKVTGDLERDEKSKLKSKNKVEKKHIPTPKMLKLETDSASLQNNQEMQRVATMIVAGSGKSRSSQDFATPSRDVLDSGPDT
ncbi:LADA_0C07910g1_1 [Lachancea dasiensis]|uniref:LADA_0C07910g1_1 n=1 Tax=Lachancea dasiensis TaxID=1072105 RepID=A0A1G4IZY4_9SACH|nr:LADA_0C07910g1_1 [Lachancea dasiensis]